MKTALRATLGLILWTTCFLAHGNQDPPVQGPLVWKFDVGKSFSYRLSQKISSKTTLGDGAEATETIDQTLETAWKVIQVQPDSTAVVDLSIKRLQMKVDGPGEQGLEYDSAAEQRPQGFAAMLATLMKTLTESSFRATITPHGEITTVEIPEPLLKAIRDAPSGELMGGLTSEEGFKNLMRQNALLLPKTDALKPGQEWSNTITIENLALGGKQTVETAYRYEGPQQVEGKLHEVFALQVKLNFGASPADQESSVKITQQQSSGKMAFDREEGRLAWSKIEQAITMEITTGQQKITQIIDQKTEFRWHPPDKPEAEPNAGAATPAEQPVDEQPAPSSEQPPEQPADQQPETESATAEPNATSG
jgi:uncharacterized protein DUF6263